MQPKSHGDRPWSLAVAVALWVTVQVPRFLCSACGWMGEAHCLTWIAVHGRRSERAEEVGPFKFARCGPEHTELVNARLHTLGIPAWHHRQWKQQSETDDSYWRDRGSAKGRLVALALCRIPFRWASATFTMKSMEERLFTSILQLPDKTHLAFADILEIRALSDFAHKNIPLDHARPDLIPLVWCGKRQMWHAAPRRDFLLLTDEALRRFQAMPCYQPGRTVHQAPAACGLVRDVIQEWSRRCSCSLKVNTLLRMNAAIATLMLYSPCTSVPALFGAAPSRYLFSINHWSHKLRPGGEPPKCPELSEEDLQTGSAGQQGPSSMGLTTERFAALAEDLRHWSHCLDQHVRSDDLKCSVSYFAGWCEWAEACQRGLHLQNTLPQARQGRQHILDKSKLFAVLWLSFSLRKDSALKTVSEQTLVALLSSGPLKEWVQTHAHSLASRLPSAASLSRSRLAFDVSWQLWYQRHMKAALTSNIPMIINLMADSTPMLGTEWFMVGYEVTRQASPSSTSILDVMHSFFTAAALLSCKEVQLVEACHEPAGLKHIFQEHTCVPTGLGSGRASIAHKVHNMVHTLGLDLNDWELVEQFCAKVSYLTTDMGVESLLASADTQDLSSTFWPAICSHKSDLDDHQQPEPQVSAFSDHPDAQPAQKTAPTLDKLFRRAAWIPGILHILHSITEDMTRSLQHFDVFLGQLRKLTAFLGNNMLMQRFTETCIQPHEEAHSFAFLFERAAACSLAEWRWMTLIQAIHVALDRMLPLRVYFKADLLRFKKAGAASADIHHAEEDPLDDSSEHKLKDCEAVVHDAFFWAYARMLTQLQMLVVKMEAFAYSCPCHPRRFEQLLANRDHTGARLMCSSNLGQLHCAFTPA